VRNKQKPVPAYSAPHTHTHTHTRTHARPHTHTHLTRNDICGHIYQDFIITTPQYIVRVFFIVLIIHNLS